MKTKWGRVVLGGVIGFLALAVAYTWMTHNRNLFIFASGGLASMLALTFTDWWISNSQWGKRRARERKEDAAMEEYGWDYTCACGAKAHADEHSTFVLAAEGCWVYENACGTVSLMGLHGPVPMPIPASEPEWQARVIDAYRAWLESGRPKSGEVVHVSAS